MSTDIQKKDTTSMSMPPDREALNLMTKLKLDRFKLRKRKFEEEHAQIMARENDLTMPLIDKIRMLSESIERLFGNDGKERYLKNFDTLLAISKANTSTSNNLLESFLQKLMKVINGGKRRSEYNYLFGLIMSQWFSGQQDEFTPIEVKSNSESLLTNERLKTIVFDRPQLDLDQWRNFLQNELFSSFNNDQKMKTAFEEFKLETENYGKALLSKKVSSTDVKRTISNLIRDNTYDDYRKRLLTKMQLDENAVNEFASSLTLMISDIAEWHWPTEGVRGVFRRNLVGRYRCYYEADFLTAIFLDHLGLKWSYHFKHQLRLLFDLLTKKMRNNCSSKSIQNKRLEMQQDEYWMASLPDKSDDETKVAYSSDNCDSDLKTKLFYLMNVEIQLHQVLQPDAPFTVVSADLEWFGPSISHEIVRIFLECCGMSPIWLDFFDRFLKQPIYYKPGEHICQRQRGVPISHSLSFLFCELLLFGLDLHIYQATGIFNYRLHDDFWFFHSQSSKIEQAWTLMNNYAQMTGLKFNDEKCGSVQIHPSNETNHDEKPVPSESLPRKDVKWGLLTLQSTGRFIINQETMTPFLDEMKIRLTNASTIVEWINLYNQYILFFMRNFGKCANILGTSHTEQMIQTFQFLHRYVFTETDGNALTIITNRIAQQFPASLTDEICEGWLYWPLTQGGLGLKNIYLNLYSVHNQLLHEKKTTFKQLPEKDVELYAEIMEEYKQSKKHTISKYLKEFIHDDGTLITFDEYIQDRETHLAHWEAVYTDMCNITSALSPVMTNCLDDHIEIFQNNMTKLSKNKRGEKMDSYFEWLVCYYAEQIESTFDQVDFIDSENLPIGLISFMKTTKIDWNNKSMDHQ